MRRLFLAAAVLCASVARAYADNDVGQGIDGFGLPIDLQQSCDDAAFNDLLEPVGFYRGGSTARRLYIAGIVGGVLLLLACLCGLAWKWRRRKASPSSRGLELRHVQGQVLCPVRLLE